MKIAIIEDNKTFREALVQLIEETEEFELSGAYANAETALLPLQHEHPDIAIVDVQLPAMSGIQLICEIRKKNLSTQFLICTIHDESETVFEALKNGAAGYILKDSNSEEILQALRDLAKGGSPMSPFIARKIIATFQLPPAEDVSTLSDREMEVLKLVAKGMLYKEIADTVMISKETVKKHLKNIYQKLHVQNKIEALNKMRLL